MENTDVWSKRYAILSLATGKFVYSSGDKNSDGPSRAELRHYARERANYEWSVRQLAPDPAPVLAFRSRSCGRKFLSILFNVYMCEFYNNEKEKEG